MNKLESTLNNIKSQREKIINNKNKILELKTKISDLKVNNTVALYAYSQDKILYNEDIDNYKQIIQPIEEDPKVQEYIILYNKLSILEQQIINYYKNIQIELRNEVNNKEPQVFVYYEKDENNNIITRNITSSQLSRLELDQEVILPVKDINSKRKQRHFYNRVSFKYLEELSKDNNYSIENKNLGKVKKLIKERG